MLRLERAVFVWFVTLAIGQLIFAGFQMLHYGGAALRGDFADWSLGTKTRFATGDDTGNTMFAIHIGFSVMITVSGLLQLLPQVRRKAIYVHRWSGRIFLVCVIILALGGLYLTWIRGAVSTDIRKVSVSLNGLLMLWFAIAAWRAVRRRDIASHRRWALRAFMMASGVWFFRVGLVAWYVVWADAPPGANDDFSGWFDILWGFGNFLLPLAILEMYFRVEREKTSRARGAYVIGLYGLTAYMAAGIIGAALFVWGPLI